MQSQKYLVYMYLLKARTFIALLIVVAFFSAMVPNFITASNLLIMTQHVAITADLMVLPQFMLIKAAMRWWISLLATRSQNNSLYRQI